MVESTDERETGRPRPGDTVMALMPGRDGRRAPRPVLVLEADRRDRIDGGSETLRLTVADSRRFNLERTFPGEFRVDQEAGMRAAGLRMACKFDTAKPQALAYDRDNFVMGRNGDPRLGRLEEADIARARKAYGWAQRKFGNLPELGGMTPPPPRAGDMVYLYSPFHDAPGEPGRKPHPCIVTGVRRETDEQGNTRVMVRHAPGTSQAMYRHRTGEMRIEDPGRLSELGLNKAGKYKLADEKEVPWTNAYICHLEPGPVMGRLTADEGRRLGLARRELMEERAAERGRAQAPTRRVTEPEAR